MFNSETHLPQILDSSAYTCPEQLEREMEMLFRPGWHCVGSTEDIPQPGDYFTFDLLGYPLVVRHGKQGVVAFLNVCSHRMCRITDEACGHSPVIKCQYHGWEFADDGATQKIPDAPSFKPLTKGTLGLTTFRTETLGKLIFVSLNPDAASLEEYFGDQYEHLQRIFGEGRGLTHAYTRELDSNWKLMLENAVESYHINMVHAKSLVSYPDAENCFHETAKNRSTFTTHREPFAVEKLMYWIAGLEQRKTYTHTLFYPTHTYVQNGQLSVWESVLPDGVDRCRVVVRMFLNEGTAGTLGKRIIHGILGREATKILVNVNSEDAGVLPSIQRGHQSPIKPAGGLISRREERIFHFQQFVKESLGL